MSQEWPYCVTIVRRMASEVEVADRELRQQRAIVVAEDRRTQWGEEYVRTVGTGEEVIGHTLGKEDTAQEE